MLQFMFSGWLQLKELISIWILRKHLAIMIIKVFNTDTDDDDDDDNNDDDDNDDDGDYDVDDNHNNLIIIELVIIMTIIQQ